jgi:transcriptional regulator with XRE-family HTH domain
MTRGKRIKDLMEQHNVDVKELADSIGKTVQYVYQLLKDENTNPTIEVMKGIARKFGVTIDYLEEGINEDIIAINNADILQHLTDDLKEWVSKKDSVPFIRIGKIAESLDLSKLSPDDIKLFMLTAQFLKEQSNN